MIKSFYKSISLSFRTYSKIERFSNLDFKILYIEAFDIIEKILKFEITLLFFS